MTRSHTIAQILKVALIGAGVLWGATSEARAQDTPQAVQLPRGSAPRQPTGMWAACTPDKISGAMTPNCWVIQYKGVTTWAYSYNDNRMAFGIVSYDANGAMLRNVSMGGARYVYKITVDPTAQTVTVWGQSDGKAVINWSDLPAAPTPTPPSGPPVYTWTTAATPPANVVTSVGSPQSPICRATDQSNRLWTGWWDGSVCNGSYAGNRMPANQNIEFLVQVQGTANWVAGEGGNQFAPIPGNLITAGPTFSGYNQPVCSYRGRTGWIYLTICETTQDGQGSNIPYALTGTLR